MRLDKGDIFCAIFETIAPSERQKIIDRALEELFEYKDIEENYGINLIKFVKAVMGGYYVKETSENYWEPPVSIFKYNAMENFKELLDKDYGTKWALTEEELTNE